MPSVEEVLEFIRLSRNVDFSGFHKSLSERKIEERIQFLNLHSISDYMTYLKNNPGEVDVLIDEVVVKFSFFFRNPLVFELLRYDILPKLLSDKKDHRELRIWCAGCSSGEEPYSVAIILNELMKQESNPFVSFIFATDVSQPIMEAGSRGVYAPESLENVRLGLLKSNFKKDGKGKYILNDTIKEMVHFSIDDLTSDKRFAPPESVFGGFDLILCRNVIIYYDKEIQGRIVNKLYKALDNKGHLILGSCEYLPKDVESRMIPVHHKSRIYRKP
jgi:chemotaxis methyl-accepting protein methylase